MLVSEIIKNVQNSLADDGVYRTDTFLLGGINEGHKLVALLSLFDERRTSVGITGTRNMLALPTSGDAECIVPLYVADSDTGNRVQPARLDQFELYASNWEGEVGTGSNRYYTLLSPFHNAYAMLFACPVQNTGTTNLLIIGAFVPADLAATEEPRIAETYQDILYQYGRFYGYASERGRGADMLAAYQEFTKRLDAFIVGIKSRFPSGRDYEPTPTEFLYANISSGQQKQMEERSE